MASKDLVAALAAPFAPEQVHWRIGATASGGSRGLALAYVDARDVMDRLDQVMRPENWQTTITFGSEGRVSCTLSLRFGEEWIDKTDVSGESDIEGVKGGASGAFKRAAVHFGVGRYLYHTESPWVEVLNKRIAQHEIPKLVAFLENGVWDGARGETPPERSSRADPPSPSSQPNRPAASPRRPPSDEGYPTGDKISDAQRKSLYAENFAALKKLGMGKEEVDNLEMKEKFAPINYALERINRKRVEQVRENEVDEVKSHIERWAEVHSQQAAASDDRNSPMDEDGDPGWVEPF